MKIISPYKDYYDFVVGKYGIDEKVVYERIPETKNGGIWEKIGVYKPPHIDSPNSVHRYVLHFCGKKYVGYYVFGDWFYGEEIKDCIVRKYPLHPTNSIDTTLSIVRKWRYEKGYHGPDWREHNTESLVNEESNSPAVYNIHRNIRLSHFNFARIMPPEEAFLNISNWISREKKIIDRQTDKEKIISHGFDTKTSFRKM